MASLSGPPAKGESEPDERNEEKETNIIEAGLENGSTSQPSNASQYSQFDRTQKRLILFIVSFAATFSPLSSFIFFPSIDALSQSLHVTVEKINLTVTSYMIVSGIGPAIIGDMADTVGRRPVYILIIAIYCLANVGLALQSKWIALFLLRMMQSAGSAGMFFSYNRLC
jgi:predicted MFS family arabinose efflux permease